MANTYVDAISSALQEYQTGASVPYGAAKQLYKDLAWHGLEKTAIYSKLPEADKIRIRNRFGAESIGRSVDQGMATETAPVGKPCNQ